MPNVILVTSFHEPRGRTDRRTETLELPHPFALTAGFGPDDLGPHRGHAPAFNDPVPGGSGRPWFAFLRLRGFAPGGDLAEPTAATWPSKARQGRPLRSRRPTFPAAVGATLLRPPGGVRRPQRAGENPLITCRSRVGDGRAVHVPDGRPPARPTRSAATAGRRDRVVHRFSPAEQRPLCPVKFFGIMALFGGFRPRPRPRVRSSKTATLELSLLSSREAKHRPGRHGRPRRPGDGPPDQGKTRLRKDREGRRGGASGARHTRGPKTGVGSVGAIRGGPRRPGR